MASGKAPQCTVAIAQDGGGRHYFVSVDGARYREVPYFPFGAEKALALFEEHARAEKSEVELERKYRRRIVFMPAVE
jgi:hypothetical protein